MVVLIVKICITCIITFIVGLVCCITTSWAQGPCLKDITAGPVSKEYPLNRFKSSFLSISEQYLRTFCTQNCGIYFVVFRNLKVWILILRFT